MREKTGSNQLQTKTHQVCKKNMYKGKLPAALVTENIGNKDEVNKVLEPNKCKALLLPGAYSCGKAHFVSSIFVQSALEQ